MIIILSELIRFYCTFQNHIIQRASGLMLLRKPAPAPPSGSSSKLMKHFLNRLLPRKGTKRFGEKRYVHTVYMDQAALDRHKTFTVLLYMMHKYKNICNHRFCSLSGVFAIKQQSLKIERTLIYSMCYHWCGPVIAGWTLSHSPDQ